MITSQPIRRKPKAHWDPWVPCFEDPWPVVEASELWEALRLLGGSLQPREVGVSSFHPPFNQSSSPFIRLMHSIGHEKSSQDWCRVWESMIQGYIRVIISEFDLFTLSYHHKYRKPRVNYLSLHWGSSQIPLWDNLCGKLLGSKTNTWSLRAV